jgi:probable LLM family oxidoreductase
MRLARSTENKMSTHELEFGLDTFIPVTVDDSGRPVGGDQVIRNTVEEAVLADSVGIDSFNIGEHYRPEFMDSAGHVLLAAIASRTERIRLGTSVTVLSTQDPVRLYTNFATLDAVSDGRAQLIVGRGSLTESFPLFGFDLADYESLFEEKLDLLMRLLRDQPVTWSGDFRAPLTDQVVSPPIREGHIPTWVGVGGSPQSVMRAARFGLPLMLAVIGGNPKRFAPYVDLYKRALEQLGQPALPIGLHSLGFVAPTDQEAMDIQWPYWKEQFEWAASERGWRQPTLDQFHAEVADGSMYVGSPETVANRIAAVIRTLGLSRFDLAYAVGRVPHAQRIATIELYGREVIPRVRELLSAAPGTDDMLVARS